MSTSKVTQSIMPPLSGSSNTQNESKRVKYPESSHSKPLTTFPLEIRTEIYTHMIATGSPSILCTSKEIYAEAIPLLYKAGILRLNLAYPDDGAPPHLIPKYLENIQDVVVDINMRVDSSFQSHHMAQGILPLVAGPGSTPRESCEITIHIQVPSIPQIEYTEFHDDNYPTKLWRQKFEYLWKHCIGRMIKFRTLTISLDAAYLIPQENETSIRKIEIMTEDILKDAEDKMVDKLGKGIQHGTGKDMILEFRPMDDQDSEDSLTSTSSQNAQQ